MNIVYKIKKCFGHYDTTDIKCEECHDNEDCVFELLK